MDWASPHIEKLKRGETVQFRPRGNSMTPYIKSGDLVRVRPFEDYELVEGVIALCKVNGRSYLHFIRGKNGSKFLIGNARGGINGWTQRSQIFGIVERLNES